MRIIGAKITDGLASAFPRARAASERSDVPYNGQVWPPVGGWKTDTVWVEASSFVPLKSEFLFDTKMKTGQVLESHIVIRSSAVYDPKEKSGTLFFDIKNEGQSDIRMFMNIPVSPDTDKDLVSAVVSSEKPTSFKYLFGCGRCFLFGDPDLRACML
jgi:hypothetical protein